MRKKSNAPSIFDQDWFVELEVKDQLYYLYVRDKASGAGLYRTNKRSFEKPRNIRIDENKFLDAVNSIDKRISVLEDYTWFLNYHISERHGHTYNPKNNWQQKDVDEALKRISRDLIKGISNTNDISASNIKYSNIKPVNKSGKTPSIFDQDWFINLDIKYQLFYLYIHEKASNGGFYVANKYIFEETREVKIDLNKFLKAVNKMGERISVLKDGRWFLNYYISEQYGNNPRNNRLQKYVHEALQLVPPDLIKGIRISDIINASNIKISYIKSKQIHFDDRLN